MHFSLIIPIYNRPEEIDELLESLTKQTYTSNYEIVIIEDDKVLTTSLHIADGSKANHKAVMQLIKTHIHHFNRFGSF